MRVAHKQRRGAEQAWRQPEAATDGDAETVWKPAWPALCARHFALLKVMKSVGNQWQGIAD
jgi:hypothetical protein